MHNIKAVLDTNQFVSSLLSRKGVQARLLDAWKSEYFELIISYPIIEEITKVLNYPRIRDKYKLTEAHITSLISLVSSSATVVAGKMPLDAIQDDPSDNIFLACAVGDVDMGLLEHRSQFNQQDVVSGAVHYRTAELHFHPVIGRQGYPGHL